MFYTLNKNTKYAIVASRNKLSIQTEWKLETETQLIQNCSSIIWEQKLSTPQNENSNIGHIHRLVSVRQIPGRYHWQQNVLQQKHAMTPTKGKRSDNRPLPSSQQQEYYTDDQYTENL